MTIRPACLAAHSEPEGSVTHHPTPADPSRRAPILRAIVELAHTLGLLREMGVAEVQG